MILRNWRTHFLCIFLALNILVQFGANRPCYAANLKCRWLLTKREVPAEIIAAQEVLKSIDQRIFNYLHKKGHTQLTEVQTIYEQKWSAAKAENLSWPEYVKKWELEFIERTWNPKTTPSIEEKLALFSAKSTIFHLYLIDYLLNIGFFKNQKFARGTQNLEGVEQPIFGKMFSKVRVHRLPWDFWLPTIYLPQKRPVLSEHLSSLLIETLHVVLKTKDPEPRFWGALFYGLRNFGLRDGQWNIPRVAAQKLQDEHYRPYREAIELAYVESFGKSSQKTVDESRELLTLEAMVVLKPLIYAALAYGAYSIESSYQQDKEKNDQVDATFRESVGASQDVVPYRDDEKIKQLEAQIEEITLEKRALERSLETPNLPAEEKQALELKLRKNNSEISRLYEDRQFELRKATRVHPE